MDGIDVFIVDVGGGVPANTGAPYGTDGSYGFSLLYGAGDWGT